MKNKVVVFTLSAVLFALSLPAKAQQPAKLPRIGYLSVGSRVSEAPRVKAFREGLRQLGYIENKNIVVEYRFGEGQPERLSGLAADLVHVKVDVIVAGGISVRAAKKGTSTIPIVMTVSTDPVASGYVESLARPGGNITGLSSMAADLSGKRLELFKESFPKVHDLGVISTATSDSALKETQTVARALGFKIQTHQVRGPEDLSNAFALMIKESIEGLFTVASVVLTANRKPIVEFAMKNRLPALYHNEDFIKAGGLMSYAPSLVEMYFRAATFVDKILKGRKPAELPVEQPTKFEFIINLKTAKLIGVMIPPNVLARADRVIR